MTTRVLCVDDEPKVLKALRRKLYGNFAIDVAEGPEAGLRAVEEKDNYGVVLSDMRMPGMDGIQFLGEVQKRAPDTVRMMLTGNADLSTAMRAVNEGNIFRFLTKPCDPADLTKALTAGMEQYRLVRSEKELLEGTLNGCIRVLTEILSMSDPETFGRANEMKELAGKVARKLGVRTTWEVEIATMLAQLGRVTIPPELLTKLDAGEGLTEDERQMLDRIPEAGGTLISHIPRLDSVARIVSSQTDPETIGEDEGDTRVGARIVKVLGDLTSLEGASGSRAAAMLSLRQDGRGNREDVVGALSDVVTAESESAAAEGQRAVEIPFSELRPGHVLTAPMMAKDGRRILGEGHRITNVLLARLRNHQSITGIQEPIRVEAGRLTAN